MFGRKPAKEEPVKSSPFGFAVGGNKAAAGGAKADTPAPAAEEKPAAPAKDPNDPKNDPNPSAKSPNPVVRAIGPRTSGASLTLYERMGGEQKLDNIVTGVYNAMKADREIGKFFARFRLEKLKERTVDYLRGEYGGELYQGSDLWLAHSHLGVNGRQYDIMMKYYAKLCKKERIGKQETQEILVSLENMRGPTIDRDLKYKMMYLKYSEKLAKQAGGDGWGKVASSQAERDEKEKQTRKLLQKAAEEEALLAAKKQAEEHAKEQEEEKKKAQAKAKAAPAKAPAKAAAKAPAAKAAPKAAPGQEAIRKESRKSTPPKDEKANDTDATTSFESTVASNRETELSFDFSPCQDCPPEPLLEPLLTRPGLHLRVSL